MPSWCSPEKGQKGAVFGEIFFGERSTTLVADDKKELDKLADVLATFHGEVHDFDKPSLLLLGDTDGADSPKPDPDMGKKRAIAVEQYLRSKLPPQAGPNIKIEPAGKGGAALPGMQPPSGQARRRVVQIINKGKPITRMAAPLRKAASLAEALAVARQALSTQKMEKNPAARIDYWINKEGKASLERGDDQYLHGMNATVRLKTQSGGPELSSTEWTSSRMRTELYAN